MDVCMDYLTLDEGFAITTDNPSPISLVHAGHSQIHNDCIAK
jgi:hypothetical protein